MSLEFSSDFFNGNRKRLMEIVKQDVVVLAANSLLQKNADESFEFRQDSSFWYFTGINVPDAVLVMSRRGPETFLLLPPRAAHRDQWDGAIDTTQLQKTSGISEILTYKEGWPRLKALLAKTDTIGTLLPPVRKFYEFYGMHANPSRRELLKVLKRAKPGIEFENIRDAVKVLRLIKQENEIDAIRKAIAVTEDAFRKVQAARPLLYEYEAEAIFHLAIRRDGFEGVGFDTIVATGKNAATVHYRENNQPINDDDFLLIDGGARYGYYSADISRVFAPKSGMNQRQKDIFDAVKEVKSYAESIMKAGVAHREYENLVQQYMGEKLVQLKVLQTVTEEGVRKYFPSLTSHHLGLDTHDIANYDETLVPGMVLTIEPGIYLPEENIGLRIEDDYLVTLKGIENLSPDLPGMLE